MSDPTPPPTDAPLSAAPSDGTPALTPSPSDNTVSDAPAPDAPGDAPVTAAPPPDAEGAPAGPDLSRYPRTESGRILPRWVVLCPFVERHFITHAFGQGTTHEAPHPALAAWRDAPPTSAMRRVWTSYAEEYEGPAVYAVHNLAPETWATLAAWYSRSALTLRQNLLRAIACGDIRLPDSLVQNVPSPVDGDDGCVFRESADGGFNVHYGVLDATTVTWRPPPPQYAPAQGGPGYGGKSYAEELHADPRWAPPAAASDGMLERSRAFHTRWTVGYGHASVAEGAVLYLCVDGCSILAAKALEEARIGASYTEKSSRYVDFQRAGFVPAGMLGVPYFAPEAEAYERAMRAAIDAYAVSVDAYTEAAQRLPGASTTSKAAIKGWVFDRARDHLPCGMRTGLAMTINARALAHRIPKLRASTESPEVQFIGALLLDVAHRVCPSLVRHADALPPPPAGPLPGFVPGALSVLFDPWVRAGTRLTHTENVDKNAWRLLGAVCEERGLRLDAYVSDDDRFALLKDWSHTTRGPHEGLSRAAEAVHYTVDMVLPYAAWRDVQRHRTLTVVRTPCPDFRASDPDPPHFLVEPAEGDPEDVRCPTPLVRVIELARATRALLAKHTLGSSYTRVCGHNAPSDTHTDTDAQSIASPLGAAIRYATPLGSRVLVRVRGNLRAWAHFVELRSRREGHDDYRVIAQQVGRALIADIPGLHLRIDVEPRTFARK